MSPEALDSANERLINLVNQNGDVFLSHTKLREGFALRLAIGHLQTTERHVRRAWDLLVESSAEPLEGLERFHSGIAPQALSSRHSSIHVSPSSSDTSATTPFFGKARLPGTSFASSPGRCG